MLKFRSNKNLLNKATLTECIDILKAVIKSLAFVN